MQVEIFLTSGHEMYPWTPCFGTPCLRTVIKSKKGRFLAQMRFKTNQSQSFEKASRSFKRCGLGASFAELDSRMPKSFAKPLLLAALIFVAPSLHASVCKNLVHYLARTLTKTWLNTQSTLSQRSSWPEDVTETWSNDKFIAPSLTTPSDAESVVGEALMYWDLDTSGEKVLVGGLKLLKPSGLQPDQIRLINYLRAKSNTGQEKSREVGVWIAVTRSGLQFVSNLVTSNEEFSIASISVHNSLMNLVKRIGRDPRFYRSFHFVHTHPASSVDIASVAGALLSEGDIMAQYQGKTSTITQ